MKQMIKYTLMIVTLLLVSLGASAQTANIIYKLDGTVQTSGSMPGNVVVDFSTRTITVTPGPGNYLTAEDLKVVKVVDGSNAHTRDGEPGFNTSIKITPQDQNADPSTTTVYTFNDLGDTNYGLEVTANFHARKSIDNATVTVAEGIYTFNKSAIKPNVTVTIGGATLAKGTDYNVAYMDSINAGTGKIIIYGIGKYTGQKGSLDNPAATYTINPKSITDVTITLTPESSTYNKIKQTPSVSVKDGETDLILNTDYTLTNEGGTNVGDYPVTVTGKGNYTGNVSKKFTINPATMEVTAEGYSGTYDGKAYGITVTAPEGATIKYGTVEGTYDQTTSPTYTNVGNYTVYYQVSMTNYAEVKGAKSVDINAKSIANATITLDHESFVFNNGNQKPSVSVKDGDTDLILDTDYTLTNEGGTNVGQYTVTVTGKGNYDSQTTASKNFNITTLETTPTVTLNETSFVYDGTEKKPAVTVTVVLPGASASTELTTDDYDVAYSENVNVGVNTAKAKVTLKRNYVGQNTATFTITPKSIANATITLTPESFVFNNGNQKPSVSVKDGETTLVVDQDYTLTNEGGTNVGEYTVTVTGKGNYDSETSASKKYNITAGNMEVTAEGFEGTYDKAAHSIKVNAPEGATIKYGIVEGTYDLTISPTYTNVGTYTVYYQVSKANYADVTGSKSIVINAKSIADVTISLTPEIFTYNGENQKPSVSVKDGETALVLDQDYTLTNEGGTNVGQYTVTVTGKGNYDSQTTASKNFNITTLETTPTVTLNETSFVYDGTEKKPAVTVTVVLPGASASTELTTDDYDVAYSENVNVGVNTAKAKVTLKRNYVGQNTATFSITPKSIANVTISDIEDQTYTGNAIQPTVVVKDGENTLEKETDYTVSYSDNVNAALSTATEHAPTVIITGKGNYDSQTTAKKTFTIGKADPMLEFSPAETSITIGKESEFTKPKLSTTPEGLSVTYASMNTEIATVNASTGDITPVAAGETEITATFAGNDNYNDGIAHYMLTVNPKTADLKYSAESVEITYGEEWTQPTLTNPDNLEITYASSNTQVATVSEAGVVTIVAAGETEISATSGDTKASYHLTVKLANPELLWVDDDQEVAEGMSYYIGDYFYGPKLKNPHQVKVKYDSDDKKVATIDPETGVIKVVGPGDTKIKAIFESDGRYSSQTVYFVLVVKEKYNLWVGSTQVSSENHKDILGDGHFFFDEESKWLIITNNTEPKVIESRMSDLTIYINGGSKLERIWFNNEGKAENTGKLYFTSYMNIPGSIDFSTSDDSGVISGFSSIGLDEDAFLYLLDPQGGSYTGGKLMTKDGATAQVATIGQYLKPLANGSTVTFPSGKYGNEDLTNKVIDNILNTLIQHAGDSDEDDDYFDSAESAIVLNNLNTTSGITLLMDNVEKGDLIPGSEEYAVKFRGGLTFMVPDGEGTITLNVKTEAGYKLMLMIGQSEPKEIVQTERGEVSFDYNVEKPTYCCLYLVQDAATSRGTRIGKRDKHHGSIQSVRVLAQKSSLNPLGEISGFPDSKTPEVEIGSEETTGIKEIKIDNTTNDPVNDDNRWFDMQGRQIEKPTKAGIYIQNKRKVIVK